MIFGASAWGAFGVLKLSGRVRAFSAICSALGEIRGEICCKMTPLPEMLERLSKTASFPADALFRRASKKLPKLGRATFGEIWREAVEESPELLLRGDEKTALSALGSTLGHYDAQVQEREIDYLSRRFEAFLREADEEKKRDSKMYAALGVASGVFCVIILL